jgi:hypothetical protein
VSSVQQFCQDLQVVKESLRFAFLFLESFHKICRGSGDAKKNAETMARHHDRAKKCGKALERIWLSESYSVHHYANFDDFCELLAEGFTSDDADRIIGLASALHDMPTTFAESPQASLHTTFEFGLDSPDDSDGSDAALELLREALASESPKRTVKKNRGSVKKAVIFLHDQLKDGQHIPANELLDLATKAGVGKESTINAAKKKLEVVSERKDFGAGGHYEWYIFNTKPCISCGIMHAG